MATTQDHQSIETVTEDKTPTVVSTFQPLETEKTRRIGPDVCESCGAGISLMTTAWVWRGRLYCDKARCKPVRRQR